jgi:hypothetical protein
MSGSDSAPSSQPGRRAGFWAFWTTLPGILTGVATLITAIVGLVALFNTSGGGQNNPPAPISTSGLANHVETSPAAPSSIQATDLTHQPAGVFVTGNIRMSGAVDVDLEKGLVGLGVPGRDLYLYCSGVDCLLAVDDGALMTTAERPGGKPACISALTTRHDISLNLFDLSTGQTLCVQTNDGHVGALRILSLPGVGTTEFVFSYTLWQ